MLLLKSLTAGQVPKQSQERQVERWYTRVKPSDGLAWSTDLDPYPSSKPLGTSLGSKSLGCRQPILQIWTQAIFFRSQSNQRVGLKSFS